MNAGDDGLEGEPMSAPIPSLRNLGPASAGWLRSAGVATVDDLKRLGPSPSTGW